jgi:hypothetical protein
MRRFLFPILLVATLVFGAAYASAILTHVMGHWSATAVEQDGSLSHMQFGPDLPRPAWVPVMPGAWVVQASRVTSERAPSGFHALDLGTRASLDDIKRFYAGELAAAGFAVEDQGIAPLNPLTAAYLGLAGTLSGRRASTDDAIDIQIRTPDGLIPSRMLQIRWRKISEFPEPAAPPPAGKS